MYDNLFRDPYFEELSQLWKSQFEIFLLKVFLHFAMLSGKVIFVQILEQVILHKLLNILQTSNSTNRVSNVN
jgi:hypothetical protein